MVKTETGVTQPPAQKCWRLLGAVRAKEESHPRASGGGRVFLTPWFQSSDTHFKLQASRTVREYISVVLNCQVYGNCLQ